MVPITELEKLERELTPQLNNHLEAYEADNLLSDEVTPYIELQKVLKPLGLKIKDVLGDGNCLFRALSDQLYGHEERHERLRHKVCDYLQEHQAYFKDFFFSEAESFEEHISNMRELRTYGDNLELAAFANMLFVDVHVHQSDRTDALVISGIDLKTKKSNVEEGKPVLHIVYHDWEHYSSTRLIKKSIDTTKLRVENKDIIVSSPRKTTVCLNRVNDSISSVKADIIISNEVSQKPLTESLSYDSLLLTEISEGQINQLHSPVVTTTLLKSREASPEIITPISFMIDSTTPSHFSRVRSFEEDVNLIYCYKRRKLSHDFSR